MSCDVQPYSAAQNSVASTEKTDSETEYVSIERNKLSDLQSSMQELTEAASQISESTDRIVVLNSEPLGMESPTGWLVSDVNEVREVDEETLDAENVGDTDHLRGLLKDDKGFTLWLEPDKFTA